MKFLPIPKNRFPEIVAYMRNTFYISEPMIKSLGPDKAGATSADTDQLTLKSLQQGFCMMALSNDNTIAGVCLNGVVRPGDFEKSLRELDTKTDPNYIKIVRLIIEENQKLDLFRSYAVDKIFEFKGLYVDPKLVGQGIGFQLVNMSHENAIKNGFTVLKGEPTSLFSKKMLEKLQFKTISETRFDSIRNADGSIMFPVEPPHDTLSIMIKQTK